MENQLDNIKHSETGSDYLHVVRRDLANKDSAIHTYLSFDLLGQLPKPPSNSDKIVSQEIDFIIDMMQNASDEQIKFAQNVHDLDKNYKLWSIFANKILSTNYSPKFFATIANQTDGLINYIKLKFARPRPYVLAAAYKKPFKTNVDHRFSTASYPSGHSCEAYMFAGILGRKYPKKHEILNKFAEKLANSRIIAGVHFPTDILSGKILANQIVKHNLCNCN